MGETMSNDDCQQPTKRKPGRPRLPDVEKAKSYTMTFYPEERDRWDRLRRPGSARKFANLCMDLYEQSIAAANEQEGPIDGQQATSATAD